MARLRDRVQNALDEARLLILGAQVLLGFEYRSVFEKGFEQLPAHSRYLKLLGLSALLITLALLIWPGSYHRIVNKGVDSEDLHQFTTRVMTWALLPFALALGFDMFVASERVAGPFIGITIGVFAAILAIYFWYVLEAIERKRHTENKPMSATRAKSSGTKLRDKIKHVLTEARVVLPGAQALLGFQLITFLMDGFEKLSNILKYVHLVSLCLTAVSIILLMTPAAYHRIVERGEETEHFHRFASKTLLAAMAPLAFAVCSDFFVVVWVVTESEELALISGGAMLLLFLGLWFVMPAYWRVTGARRAPHHSRAPVAQG
jgi:Family of unknown function (DUF6328)